MGQAVLIAPNPNSLLRRVGPVKRPQMGGGSRILCRFCKPK
jgi:hypothetical protein